MKYLAAIHSYQKNYQLISLNAANPEDAKREAYSRAFCRALNVPVPEDYDGSSLAHQQLLQSIPNATIQAYIERNRMPEKFDDAGNRINSVEPLTSLIKIFAVAEAFHCSNQEHDKDWYSYFTTKYRAIQKDQSESEIQKLQAKIKADQERLLSLQAGTKHP